MNWLKNLFRKKEYHGSRMYDFLSHYSDSEAELRAMRYFIRESIRFSPSGSCGDFRVYPSKQVKFRYGLNEKCVGLAWYLMEEYFKGNITIKENEKDV